MTVEPADRGTADAARPRVPPLAVVDVIDETADTRSFVLEIPPGLEQTFAYAAGQFCTFRATIDGEPVVRCYSMSSSPDTGDPLTTTVKRVPGGRMSNWMNDTLAPGDTIDVMRPTGLFVLRAARRTDRRVRRRQRHHAGDLDHQDARSRPPRAPIRLVYANRNADSVIFAGELDRLRVGVRRPARRAPPPRLRTRLPRRRAVRRVGRGTTRTPTSTSADRARTWTRSKPASRRSASRRTQRVHRAVRRSRRPRPSTVNGSRSRVAGDPARPPQAHRSRTSRATPCSRPPGAAGLRPPFSCEAGNCATCMAHLDEGSVTMRVNNALSAERGRRRLGADVPVDSRRAPRSSSTTTLDRARVRARARARRGTRSSGPTTRCARRGSDPIGSTRTDEVGDARVAEAAQPVDHRRLVAGREDVADVGGVAVLEQTLVVRRVLGVPERLVRPRARAVDLVVARTARRERRRRSAAPACRRRPPRS